MLDGSELKRMVDELKLKLAHERAERELAEAALQVERTQRLHTEETLRQCQYHLDEGQAVAHLGSWVAGIAMGEGLTCSKECYRILGIAPGTPLTVQTFYDHVHPDDRAQVREASLAAPYSFEGEHRIVRSDGEVRWVFGKASVIRDGDGAPMKRFGVIEDVTARRHATEQMRLSEERYRHIVESTSEGVWVLDAEGKTSFANTRMAAMLGYGREEMAGRMLLSFMDDEARSLAVEKIARRRRGIAESHEHRLRRKDGSALWVQANTSPVMGDDGQYKGALALVTDITERRRTERARNQLAAIVESSVDAIMSVDLWSLIETWNEGAERLFGYGAHEAVGSPVTMLSPEGRIDEQRAIFAQIPLGNSVGPLETVSRRKDGSLVDVSLMISPIRDPAGQVTGASCIIRDLTEKRKAEALLRETEQQLRQAQKLEAVGTLAGGIAHDFNNILSVILGYSCLAIADLEPGQPLRDDLEQVTYAAERARDLTRQLLAFSRRQLLEPRVIDLNHSVRSLDKLLTRTLGEHIELTLDLAQDMTPVYADPNQVEQVIMNLVLNARDAMPEGGRLCIQTNNLQVEACDASTAQHEGVTPGPYVMLTVTDTGIGMDSATAARIFEPFFTTKGPSKGTGLGLSTVYGIVKQSGGYATVDTTKEVGSKFTVCFPRTDRARISSMPVVAGASARGQETILLAEDDNAVRATLVAILSKQGYHVLEAHSGDEALSVCERHAGKIDLLLTDVIMPRMNGRVLAERALGVRPELKVIYISGYSENSLGSDGVLAAEVAYLQKPVTPDALTRKVRSVLDG